MKKSILPIAVLLASAFSFTSCSNEDDDNAPVTATAQVQVVHASPYSPNVDVYANNKVTSVTNLSYGNNSAYTNVAANTTTELEVSSAGTKNVILDVDTKLSANKSYSLWLYDSLTAIKAVVVEDNIPAAVSGKAHVRFFHLSPNAPAVDILLNNNAAFTARTFGDLKSSAAVSQFVAVDAGTFKLDVRLSGSVTIPLSIPAITFESGKVYTIYAKGIVGGIGAQALATGVITNK